MSGAWVVMAWLAALPCQDASRDAQRLREAAALSPDALDVSLQEVARQWEGLPLPDGKEALPAERAEAAARRLQRACAWLDAERSTPASPLPTDRARLQEILSRAEFAQARQRQGDVLQRVLRRVRDWLEGLLETRQALSFATSTRTVVLVLGVAVVLFALLRLRHWRRTPAGARAREEARHAAALQLASPGEHLTKARAALGGEPREAIRQGLLAMLSSLEERKLARPDRVKTNRELVGELPGRGASARLTGEVERLVRWYDRAFYSLEPVGSADAARFVDEVERFHQTREAVT